MKSYILITSQSLRVKEVTYYDIQEWYRSKIFTATSKTSKIFPKKLIRAVSGTSRLLAWDHFRWFVDLLIDILPVSFQVGAILWCLNVFFCCCCCCCFVQNYLKTEWNHLLLACSRNHSTFPSTIVRLCESSTRERAWRGSENNTLCDP